MKPKELRELSDDELAQRLRERLDDLSAFRMQTATSVVDNVRAAREARRDVARIKTIQGERNRAAEKVG